MDRELLAKLERYLQTGYTPDLRQQAVEEIKALHRAVLRYRWQKLADADLVLCVQKTDHVGRQSYTHRRVVHRADCRNLPRTTSAATTARYWMTGKPSGLELAMAIEQGAHLCKICRPDVDVDGVID